MSDSMTAAEFNELEAGKRKSKYRNVKTVIDGITFDSKAEAKRYGELKPGDKIFVGPWVLIDDGEAYQLRGEGHFIGDVLMAPPDKDAAPYTDNLSAVARVLAAHPNIGDAVQAGIEALHEESANAEHWRGIRDYRITEPLEAMETLKALAAALNGGTE